MAIVNQITVNNTTYDIGADSQNVSFTGTAGNITELSTNASDAINALDTAAQGKQDNLVSGTNIKTVNNTSLLGSGNIDVGGGLPVLTITGSITPTVSGGSVTDSNLKYALTSDKSAGIIYGDMIVKGAGASTVITMNLNLQVASPPSAITINGVMSSNVNFTGLTYAPKMTIDTSGNVKLTYACTTNNTYFSLTPTLMRFSDFV